MIRILKAIGIPNVVAFKLSDGEQNVEAAKMSVIKRNRFMEDIKRTNQISKSNAYLAKQFKRLEKYAKNDQLAHFNFLGRKLLTSYAFQIQAYNSVCDKWYGLKMSTIKHHLRYLRFLCHNRSTNIDMKRVWIDKKPGDYARPLGVPSMVWRVYLRMLTNLGEAFVNGKGLYSSFQHGGRPGYGVQSCLISMSRMLEKYPRVYEFDLKGFFDHISKDAVKEFFKGTFLADMYHALLYSKPNKYVLPPIEKDLAVTKHENLIGRSLEINTISLDEFLKKVEDEDTVVLEDGEDIQEWMRDPEKFLKDHNYPEKPFKTPSGLPEVYGGEDLEELEREIEIELNKLRYSKIMSSDENILFASGQIPSAEAREKGRDMWKDLDLENQGIPQGTAMGPFLASTIAAYYLRPVKNLLMYVDDGMVFLPEGASSPEEQIVQCLKPIQVELALEKSGLRETKDLMSKGIKFLGTRSFVRTYHTIMHSETRKGIQKPLINRDQLINKLKGLYADKKMTISKWKLLKWLFLYKESRLAEILTGQGLHVAIKHGFFGNLLSMAYSPEVTILEMKQKISEGVRLAEEQIRRNERSLGATLLSQDTYIYINEGGQPSEVVPDLFNLSTLSCDLLLTLGVSAIRKDDGNKVKRDFMQGMGRMTLAHPALGSRPRGQDYTFRVDIEEE